MPKSTFNHLQPDFKNCLVGLSNEVLFDSESTKGVQESGEHGWR